VSFLRSHMVLMFLYALLVGAFFALLWKHDRSGRIRTFLIIFLSLFFGGIAVGWAMYPFPLK
jgi:cytochrome bd-type quinol oxidase subunit 2